MKPGDKVRLRIGIHDYPATIDAEPVASPAHVWVFCEGLRWYVPVTRLHPVTRPCPWTEDGTLVQIRHDREGLVLFRRFGENWRDRDLLAVDWDTDIAPFNPVRLVPEVSS